VKRTKRSGLAVTTDSIWRPASPFILSKSENKGGSLMRWRKGTWITTICLVASWAPVATLAQSESPSQNVQDLRKQLDALRDQMNKIQARLGELDGSQTT
jgi:hypothetical protein